MYMTIAKSVSATIERSSWIRQMFETGNRLKAELGAENVFDFSLGNPIIEPPKKVYEVMQKLVGDAPKGQHRYMPNAGFLSTREYLAGELSENFGYQFDATDIVMCVGAAGGLNVVCKSLLDAGDEVLVLAPYFVEYRFYVENHGGVLKVANTNTEFQIDLEEIEKNMTPKTKVVIINSPNNPTGVCYPQADINALGELIRGKENEYGHAIYLVSDEPYRNILFDGLEPMHLFSAHQNSILVTSHSKDLALAGERIGYIAIHPEMPTRLEVQNALVLCTRILGFVNAPAMMQRILPYLRGVRVSATMYQELRDLFYPALKKVGFEVVQPQGAFYFFPKTPIEDDVAFVKEAQKENLLLVPGTGFGYPGHVRISYCTTQEVIQKSLPSFQRLMHKYQ